MKNILTITSLLFILNCNIFITFKSYSQSDYRNGEAYSNSMNHASAQTILGYNGLGLMSQQILDNDKNEVFKFREDNGALYYNLRTNVDKVYYFNSDGKCNSIVLLCGKSYDEYLNISMNLGRLFKYDEQYKMWVSSDCVITYLIDNDDDNDFWIKSKIY